METANIGTYLDIYQLIQELGKFKRIPVRSVKLREILKEVASRLNNEQPDKNVGLYSFIEICALSQSFKELAVSLEKKPRETDKYADWRQERYQELQELIERFNQRFIEVRNSLIIVYSGEDKERFRYYNDDWQGNDDGIYFFQRLPQISQICFRDAARCIALGLNRAGLSLAVQALEGTIRYCYRRLIPENRQNPIATWAPMVNALHPEDPQKENYISGDLKTKLNEIKENERNILSHGRAKYEFVDSYNVRDTFNRCWQRTQDLLTEMRIQSKYRLLLQVHPNFTFDAALATYLFKSNLEIPMVGFIYKEAYHKITIYPEGITENQVYDQEAKKYLPEGEDGFASMEALRYMRPQEGFGRQIEYLVDFASQRQEGFKDGLNPRRRETFDIVDLFYGIKKMGETSEPEDVLDRVWKMFDEFIPKRSLELKNNHRLIRELGLDDVYEFICQNLLT